jgi:hypothetical protein
VRWLRTAGAIVAAAFVVASIAYFLPMTWSPRPTRRPTQWQPLVAPTASAPPSAVSAEPAPSGPPRKLRILR